MDLKEIGDNSLEAVILLVGREDIPILRKTQRKI
jgi:hypothetical protein